MKLDKEQADELIKMINYYFEKYGKVNAEYVRTVLVNMIDEVYRDDDLQKK